MIKVIMILCTLHDPHVCRIAESDPFEAGNQDCSLYTQQIAAQIIHPGEFLWRSWCEKGKDI